MNVDTLKSLLWWLAIGALFFWMMRRGGCGMTHGGHAHSHDGDGQRPDPLRSASGKPIDPVCGMEIDPAHAIGTRVVAGRTFFFCSQKCIDTFDKTPDVYTRSGAAEASHHRQHGCC